MHKISATFTEVGSNPNMDDMPYGSRHYRATLRYNGRRMTVPFSCGPLAGGPDAHGVLYCLISDASGPEDFAEWCREYGYDVDSRRAERTHKIVMRQQASLRRLLREDFDAICSMDEDALKAVTE